MKTLSTLSLCFVLGFSQISLAQSQKRKKPVAKKPAKAAAVVAKPGPKIYTRTTNVNLQQQLQQALAMAKAGQSENAANALFSLSRRPELQAERPQLKYLLGLMLLDMNYNQIAAFQFVDVIRLNDKRYTKQAIEKLSVAADKLGDETLLNYAVSRLNLNELPSGNREMLYYRIGEVKQKVGDYASAADLFSRVTPKSRYYYNALFNRGLSDLEANRVDMAVQAFKALLEARRDAKITDTNKVAATMAIARALYQKGDWEGSIDYYSRIPRDHVFWHDALFEKTWAMLRAARFRSALSNFQSLHSTYYEDAYIPESLLLRAIVYLYICKYDEMEKVLGLFEKEYGPIRRQISNFIKSTNEADRYYAEVEKAQQIRKFEEAKAKLKLPYNVARHLLNQSDVKRSMVYIRKLFEERQRLEQNPAFRASAMGQYGVKVLANRIRNTKYAVGDLAKAHLFNMRAELKDLYEQAGFIRYEMINGQKEDLKKKIAGKDLVNEQIDEHNDRKFYIQNGYEYYPFQGEYWLDEIGNYHYLGKQSCE